MSLEILMANVKSPHKVDFDFLILVNQNSKSSISRYGVRANQLALKYEYPLFSSLSLPLNLVVECSHLLPQFFDLVLITSISRIQFALVTTVCLDAC